MTEQFDKMASSLSLEPKLGEESKTEDKPKLTAQELDEKYLIKTPAKDPEAAVEQQKIEDLKRSIPAVDVGDVKRGDWSNKMEEEIERDFIEETLKDKNLNGLIKSITELELKTYSGHKVGLRGKTDKEILEAAFDLGYKRLNVGKKLSNRFIQAMNPLSNEKHNLANLKVLFDDYDVKRREAIKKFYEPK